MKNTTAGGDRNITIKNGWNLIGFSSNTSFDLVNINFTNSSGTITNWRTSVSQGKLNAYVSYFASSQSQFNQGYSYVAAPELSMDDTQLRPNNGYWVRAYQDGILTLPNVGGTVTGATYAYSDLVFNNGTMELNVTNAGNSTNGWIDPSIQYWNITSQQFEVINGLAPVPGNNKNLTSSWEGMFIKSNKMNIILNRRN